jgi:hypothetical protein
MSSQDENKDTTKPKQGAPIKYHSGIPKKLTDFFDRQLYTLDENGNRVPTKLPTIERFCCEIDIVKSTFYEWVKKYPELSNAFKKAKAYQKDQLIQMALIGIYKEGFAKFVAINVTDMKDKIDHDIGKDAKNLVTLAYGLKDQK